MQFVRPKTCSEPHRMDARSPQPLVGVDVPDTAQDMLIEQQTLDSCAPVPQKRYELDCGRLQRVEAQRTETVVLQAVRQHSHATESTNIAIAQFATIIESETDMRVRCKRRGGFTRDETARHAEVDEQREIARTSVGGLKIEQKKLPVSPDGRKSRPWNLLFNRYRIVDEIRLTETHAQNAAPRQDGPKAPCDCFDFGKFRHGYRRRRYPMPQLRAGTRKLRGQALPFCRSNAIVREFRLRARGLPI